MYNLNLRLRKSYYRLFHAGSKYECPFCSHSYEAFVPAGFKKKVLKEKKVVGGGYRLNVICPFCGSGDRERLVFLFTKENQLIQKQMKLLHIAPEKRLLYFFEKAGIDYYSADLSNPLAKIRMNIEEINYASNYFDAIICNHVLEHIVDDRKAMKELFRVLTPGGWVILQVPFSQVLQKTLEDSSLKTKAERTKAYGQWDHVRIYGDDFVERLQSVGFEVQKRRMDENLTNRFALNSDEVIFFCNKRVKYP